MQYLNIALVFIFADFGFGLEYSPGAFPILVGKYRDFDTKWYYDVGAKISFAMVTNSFASFFGKLFEPLIQMAIRWLDRGFKKHLRMVTNIMEEKKVEIDKEREEKKKNGGAATKEKAPV